MEADFADILYTIDKKYEGKKSLIYTNFFEILEGIPRNPSTSHSSSACEA